MFNPEKSQMSPQSEKHFFPKEEGARPDNVKVPSRVESTAESLADFAKRPENMLPRAGDSLPEGGMETLAGVWAEKMASVREERAREAFCETVADQLAMLREELLRSGIVNGSASLGESKGDTKHAERFQGKGVPVPMESGTSHSIFEKMNLIPGGKKILGALALVAGLSAMPKDAEAGLFGDIGKVVGDIAVQSVRDIPREMERIRRADEQRRMQAEREAEQANRNMEQIKERYAHDSQRIVDQYDREDMNAERAYNSQQMQILNNGSRNKDDSLKQKLFKRAEILYHKQKLKAAEVAWNGMNRVKEKYIHISTAGASYQSQVNEAFLKNLQRIAAKEISDLAKLDIEVVSIIPIQEVSLASSPAGVVQEKFPASGRKTAVENSEQEKIDSQHRRF